MPKSPRRLEITVKEQELDISNKLHDGLAWQVGILVAKTPEVHETADFSLEAEIFLHSTVFCESESIVPPIDIMQQVSNRFALTPEVATNLYNYFLSRLFDKDSIKDIDPLLAKDSLDYLERLHIILSRIKEVTQTDDQFPELAYFSLGQMGQVAQAVANLPLYRMDMIYQGRFGSKNPFVELTGESGRERFLRGLVYLTVEEYTAVIEALDYIRDSGQLPSSIQLPPDQDISALTSKSIKALLKTTPATNGFLKLCRIPRFRLYLFTALGLTPEVKDLITASIYPTKLEQELYFIATGQLLQDYVLPRNASDVSAFLLNTYYWDIKALDIRKILTTAYIKISESSLLRDTCNYQQPTNLYLTSSSLYRFL